ncbi:MAG TPA: putative LPS assembly protein LptD, partial [Longimicrobiales bacterium]|nr:putative LPS assembly protein LptD [Longimicrobiales bacterium]
MRKLLLVIALLAAAAAPAAAQEPDSVPPTPEQRALARLRALGRVAEPDSMRPDSLGADSISIRERDGRQAGPPPSPISRDSIMERLLALRGYIGTEYAGGSARFEADSNRLQLRLNPQVSREGNQLVADSVITYDERRAEACGYGNPILHAADMTNPLQSDTVCYNVERRIGYARGARTQLDQGAQWFVRGDVYVSGDDYYSHDAIFTDCNEPWPHYHYHFAASELKIDRTSNILVARNVTMNFQDVPVFWLPFMVQSMSRGRRSGILMPRFGINDIARTSSRYSRRIEDVGVYWAISEHFGSELAMDWFANNWTALRGSLDYAFTDKFLRGAVTYRKFWKQ